MCCAFFWLNAHPQLLLLLAFNRDEYLDRPTAALHAWEGDPVIVASRDLVNGGTWLGLSRTGRFAFVTNFREVRTHTTGHHVRLEPAGHIAAQKQCVALHLVRPLRKLGARV